MGASARPNRAYMLADFAFRARHITNYRNTSQCPGAVAPASRRLLGPFSTWKIAGKVPPLPIPPQCGP